MKITPGSFDESRALFQACMAELKTIHIGGDVQMRSVWKDLLCTGLSSPAIDTALTKCLNRCTYNDLRISLDTFEPEAARGDFIPVCLEVAEVNLAPFMKSLFAAFSRLSAIVPGSPS